MTARTRRIAVSLSSTLLVSLAVSVTPVHAAGTHDAGYRAFGIARSDMSSELYGLGLALNRPLARPVHADLEFSYERREQPLQSSNLDLVSSREGSSSLSSLVASLDFRVPIRGHTSPFMRVGAGAALLRTGTVPVTEWTPTMPRRYEIAGSNVFGGTVEVALGFGRLPSEGLGWEAALRTSSFIAHDQSFAGIAFVTGIVL